TGPSWVEYLCFDWFCWLEGWKKPAQKSPRLSGDRQFESVFLQRGVHRRVHYVASKGGVLSLTRGAASCHRPRGSCPAVVWPFAWVSPRPPRRSHRASTYEASRQRGAHGTDC